MRGALHYGTTTATERGDVSQWSDNGGTYGSEALKRQHTQQQLPQHHYVQHILPGRGLIVGGQWPQDDAERSTIDMYEDAVAERSTHA